MPLEPAPVYLPPPIIFPNAVEGAQILVTESINTNGSGAVTGAQAGAVAGAVRPGMGKIIPLMIVAVVLYFIFK